MKRVVHTIALLVTAAALGAQQPGQRTHDQSAVIWAPPDLSLPEDLPGPTVPLTMVTRLNVAGWPIELEQTELQQAQKHFGGTIGNSGDASEALGFLCLYGKDNGGLWALWLMSGEPDGKSVGSIQWERLPPDARMDPRCKLLASGGVDLPVALRLDMRRKDAERVLGKPTSVYHDSDLYSHEHKLTIKNEPYSADNNLFLKFRNGVLWSLVVNYSIIS